MQDDEILKLYRARDEKAVEETQAKYDRYIKTVAYNILADAFDCEECANDVYMKLWETIPPAYPDNFQGFVAMFTRRTAIDLLRKNTRKKRRGSQYDVAFDELEEVISDTYCPEKHLEAGELAGVINAFLLNQPEKQRIVFVARYYYLDSVRQIADYMSMSESKVKSILHRMRLRLKKYLESEGYVI